MRYSKAFVCSLLCFTVPSLAICPYADIPLSTTQVQETSQRQLSFERLMSFDDILNLIDDLENGELERKCSEANLEHINHFLAKLAKQGFVPNGIDAEIDLENDIEELLYGKDNLYEYSFSWDDPSDGAIIPAVFYDQGDVVLCKSWVHKKWDRTKKFVKKHKKAILIGAAIIVVAAVIICSVGTASAAGVLVAAAAAGSDLNENKAEEKTPSTDEVSALDVSNATTILQDTLTDKINSFKEFVADDVVLESLSHSASENNPTFQEKVREVGAFLAHDILSGIAELGAVVPELFEEVKEFGSSFFPELSNESKPLIQSSPKENYDHFFSECHQKIDEVFGTDGANHFKSEVKLRDDFSYGILPPPGNFFKGINVSKFQEIVGAGQETAVLAEELGFSAGEITQLQKTGAFERVVTSTFESVVSEKAMLDSYEKFKAAKEILSPYKGQYLSEIQARELIHQTGIKTFPRPAGIPENFKIRFTDKGAGMIYCHPENNHISIRVMPGKPHSPFPHQQNPYVIQMMDGDALDKYGNIVNKRSPEAHIPIDEFVYRRH